jgi:hypothetical protein
MLLFVPSLVLWGSIFPILGFGSDELPLEFSTTLVVGGNFEVCLVDEDDRRLFTTFRHEGFSTLIYYNNRYMYDVVTIAYGASGPFMVPAITTLSEQVDPYTIIVTINANNTDPDPVDVSPGHAADISIDGHLCPHVRQFGNGNGFSMISNNISLSLILRNSRYATDVLSYWFGYFERQRLVPIKTVIFQVSEMDRGANDGSTFQPI